MKRWQVLSLLGVMFVIALIFVAKSMLAETDGQSAGATAGSVTPEEVFQAALDAHRPALILFRSLTCVPCKQMEALVNEVRPEFEDQIAFIDVNVYHSQNQGFIRKAGVRAIPTTVLVDSQGEGRVFVGVIAPEELRDKLRQLLVDAGSE